METLKSLFGCCIPGRRSRPSSQIGQQTETTPLLHASQDSSKSPTPSTSIQQQQSPSPAATAPTYTIRDLAVITGWAREHFLQVDDAGVLEQKGGKRKSLVEPVVVDQDGQDDKEKDAKVQSLVENLAKGIVFNGWSQEGGASGSGSATTTEEQKEGS